MKKILLVLVMSFILFSCSKTEEQNMQNVENNTTEITNTWVETNSGDLDTKQLEEDLSRDLDEVLNLIPEEE